MSVIWISTKERTPEVGELIAKRWKNGAVWAGKYAGSAKDSSFDEWVSLEAAETCQAIGIKHDGTMEVIGAIPLPHGMKIREIARSYFGGDPDDDMSEAYLAVGAMEEFVNWLKEQGRLK